MSNHIVSAYDAELEALDRKVTEMGGVSEKMLAEAVQALTQLDVPLAQSVIMADNRLDDLQREIEERAILTIARRQPVAIDLRVTVSAIRASGDLERIGDLAKNIAKRALTISGQTSVKSVFTGLRNMNELALDQLNNVLDAYTQQDVAKAVEVWQRDEAIDTLYNSLFRELLTYMMEDPRNISFCAHLLFCAKNIERVGDHVTNIAETIHYLVTGESLTTERPKSDSLAMSQASTAI